MTDVTPIRLPDAFQEKMKVLLGEEYKAFIQSYEQERVQGLRLNELKTEGAEEAANRMPESFQLRAIPWVRNGYYYEAQSRPGKHPYHEAGVYYIQEPSAMAVVELLAPRPGDMVLDLCAAPGGKTTHIASCLMGEGFLLSNEIHPARAKILSQNVERMGVKNAVVTNAEPRKLIGYFPEFFDKIVVDAPCSGEGMFRKEEIARTEWSPDHVVQCAGRQAEILDQAACMLKRGGRIVYSTCTFSPEENEGSIQAFLDRHPEFVIEKIELFKDFSQGRPQWTNHGCDELRHTFRIWPHKVEGEGHYLAALRKDGEPAELKRTYPPADRQIQGDMKKEIAPYAEAAGVLPEQMVLFGEQVYALPKEMVDYKGLKVLRAGLHLGTIKKNRFEPSHALALHLKKNQGIPAYEMKPEEVSRYVRGEILSVGESDSRGWVLMLVDGYTLGWAKKVGATLKNHYPKGLRRTR